jgi:rhamnulokinase
MSSAKNYVACDLGAESGRVVLGKVADGKVRLEECHRFPTGPTVVNGSLRWNLLRFYDEIQNGLNAVGKKTKEIDGLSVDAWGVDYAYFSEKEPLLGLPFHYRDARTDTTFPNFMKLAGKELIFSETGVQFMQINTLYQLYDDALNRRSLVEIAKHFLGIADYVHFLLCQEACVERSYVSTSQLFSPVENRWSQRLIDLLGLPGRVFAPVVDSGTRIGALSSELAGRLNLKSFPIFATCSHDTGAAVAAVPAKGGNWAYLSSGTWSLLGVELQKPFLGEACLLNNYTNELGFERTVRFLRNILGLWILQETRREMVQKGADIDYPALVKEAESAPALVSIIHPNEPEFLKPGNMIEKVQNFCRRTGQPIPETRAALARCILESLALSYASQLAQLQEMLGIKIQVLHVVGGGSQNRLLNRLTASAAGMLVAAGPVEATALGNILIQAVASGELGSLKDLREVIRNSYTIEEFEPEDAAPWAEALQRYESLTK